MSKCVLSVVALLSLAACGRWELAKLVDLGPVDAGAGDPAPPGAACADAGAPPAIPLGVYPSCTSRVDQSGSSAESAGGTISLDAIGDALTVTVGDGVFAFGTGTLVFTPLTTGAAVVAPGQTYPIAHLACATATAPFGALALEGDELTVSLLGDGCGRPTRGELRCTVPASATGTLALPGSACPPPAFAVGTYGPCTTITPAAASGTVVITQGADGVTMTFKGATSVAPANGTLRFTPTTTATATIRPGQSLDVLVPGAFAPSAPDTMMITSGTIVVDGPTLFGFLRGNDATGTALREAFHCGAEE
jgi:hypothetical protein